MSRPTPAKKTIESWIKDLPELAFHGTTLRCNLCNTLVSWARKSHVMQHIRTEKHLALKFGEATTADIQRQFNLELVKVMITCNIPWKQIDNPILREFLQKCVNGEYSNVYVPAEVTIRKNYLPELCETIKSNIRSELKDKYLWLNVDETTTASGLKVANVLVGALEENCATRSHLIASKVLQTTNAQSIQELVTDSLRHIWGDEYERNKCKFLLFITDATADMKAAGQILAEKYEVLHLTCLVHGLHRVSEVVRECYPNVDTLIASVKKIFQKTSERQNLFHEKLPNTPLPPQPVITRWSTWIEAASYYYYNIENIKKIIQDFDPHQSVAIASAQEVLQDPTLYRNLDYIHAHFSHLPVSMQKLEQSPHTDTFSIIDAVNILFDLRQNLWHLSGTTAETVKEKFNSVLDNNPGFSTISLIVDLLNNKEVDFSSVKNISTLRHFSYFKYAPVTSCDIERSFSQLNWIYSDRHRRITPEHLEDIMLIYYYNLQ